MNLYAIENDTSVDLLLASAHYRSGTDVIICFNYLCCLRLKREPGEHCFFFIEELFTPEEYEQLHQAMDQFATTWYKQNSVDYTLFDGISYGKVIEGKLYRTYMISVLVKYGETIRKAIRERPDIDTIYCDFSNEANYFYYIEDDRGRFFNKELLVREVGRQLDVRTFHIQNNNLIPSLYLVKAHATHIDEPLKTKIATFVLGMITAVSSFFSSLKKREKKIYFFSYHNIESIIFQKPGAFVLSRAIKKLLRPKLLFSGLTFCDFNKIRYILSDVENDFLCQVKKECARLKNRAKQTGMFVYNAIDYSEFYCNAIEDLADNVIPKLLSYTGKVRKGINKHSLAAVVVNEVIGEYMKTVIAACRKENVPVIFMDHGIQGYAHALKVFDRKGADLVITAGTFFETYYRGQADKKRVCKTLGNPCMDKYPSRKRKKITKIKKIMILSHEDTHYARLDRFAYQEKYYEEIFSIFKELQLMEIEIYYKPHPSEQRSYHEHIMNFFNIDISDVHYVESERFDSLVWEMDFIISNVTSCYYEGLAAGIPVVFFETDHVPGALLPPLNGDNPDEIIRVSTGAEVLSIIKENYRNPEKLNLFVDRFLTKYSGKYMGALDGKAGERILNFIDKSIGCA